MFSILLRQQTQFASSARFGSPLTRQFLRGLPKVAQKPHILSQRAFSLSRSLFEQDRFQRSSGRDYPRDRPQFRRTGPPSRPTKQRTLHIGNLPYSAAEVDIRELFEPYGQIKQILLASDSSAQMMGYGFIEFEKLEDAVAAAESSFEEPFVLFERTLNINYARRSSIGKPELPPSTTLHIPNFPFPGEEAPLRRLLLDYEDHILRINFMKDLDGRHTKKVFIQFSDQETATAAFNAFQDYDFEGTTIKMAYARSRLPPRTSKMADFDA